MFYPGDVTSDGEEDLADAEACGVYAFDKDAVLSAEIHLPSYYPLRLPSLPPFQAVYSLPTLHHIFAFSSVPKHRQGHR